MKGQRTILLGLLVIITSCEEITERPQNQFSSDLLAVEGVLTNELTNHVITLSHPHPVAGGVAIPASGAVVRIVEGNSLNIYVANETPPGSGKYVTEAMRAVFGRVYTLRIQYKGRQFFASDSSVPVEPFQQPVNYQRANNESPALYRLLVDQSGTSANYVAFDLAWDQTAYCTGQPMCGGRIIFYDLKTIDVNEIAKPRKGELFFPAGTRVIRKKYSLSPNHRSFLRSVLSETEWRGSYFDIERANVGSNLSAGAIGFFGVSTVDADTTFIIEKP